jgi:predicted permease
MAWGPITVEGRTPPAGEQFINADQRTVAGDYFRVMEIPLRRGRLFNEQDTSTNPRVVVVDEHMAEQLWPNEDPIGKRIRTGGIDASDSAPWLTVVGVVGRIKQDTLDSDSRMAFYRAHTQSPGRAMNVVLRSRVDPVGLAAAVRKEIRDVDPDLPIYNVRTMTWRVDESLARRRFSMLLLTIFATLASGLAAIGIYGVVAYFVNQGTRELGIRMALGATPRGIRVLVVRHGVVIALAGVTLGLAGALVVGRFMQSLLFGIKPTDPLTFSSIAVLLGLVALVASYVPARRAARIDPMLALRRE